jgi:hypothetical protein
MERQQQMQARTDGDNAAVGIMVQESLLPVPEELAKFKEIEPPIVRTAQPHKRRAKNNKDFALACFYDSRSFYRLGSSSNIFRTECSRNYIRWHSFNFMRSVIP